MKRYSVKFNNKIDPFAICRFLFMNYRHTEPAIRNNEVVFSAKEPELYNILSSVKDKFDTNIESVHILINL